MKIILLNSTPGQESGTFICLKRPAAVLEWKLTGLLVTISTFFPLIFQLQLQHLCPVGVGLQPGWGTSGVRTCEHVFPMPCADDAPTGKNLSAQWAPSVQTCRTCSRQVAPAQTGCSISVETVVIPTAKREQCVCSLCVCVEMMVSSPSDGLPAERQSMVVQEPKSLNLEIVRDYVIFISRLTAGRWRDKADTQRKEIHRCHVKKNEKSHLSSIKSLRSLTSVHLIVYRLQAVKLMNFMIVFSW